jgi:tripartite-type tricarboxylate transporter receptor subunit TctC
MNNRRDFIALGAASWLASPVFAQAAKRVAPFPRKPLRIVVPNAAGGAADLTARTVGEKLAAALGQPVVIDNKPGAGGVVAGETVARAEADGHTLLLVSSGTAVSAALFKSLPFDTLKDFAPVSMLATFDLAIASSARGPFKTMADVLAYARSQPGKLNIGTPQVGTTQNLAAELFKSTAGIQAQIVPFNGTPPVITALRGGEIDIMVEILGPLMPQVTSGAMRVLAVMGDHRATQLPGVAALHESGGTLAKFNVSSWNGLAVPAKTPPAVVDRLSAEIQKVMALPDVKERLLELNLVARGSTPTQLGEHLAADVQRWSDVIARANIPRQ